MEYSLNDRTRLYDVCRRVEPDEDISELAAAMLRIVRDYRALGLAANQIGDNRRVIVLNTVGFFGTVLVNPCIVEHVGRERQNTEGCLSFPGKLTQVWRSPSVVVHADRYNGGQGGQFRQKLKGVAAYCAQHEIDHLNGICLFPRGEGL